MSKGTSAHPKDNANFISLVTLWWIVGLLWKGSQNPLDHDDLDEIREDERSECRTKRLEELWRNEESLASRHHRKPKLWKVMLRYFTWREYGYMLSLGLTSIIANNVIWYSIIKLLEVVGSTFQNGLLPRSEGLVYVYGMTFGFAVESVLYNQINLQFSALGIRARAALVGLIYKKVLCRSQTSFNMGEVMELICSDTQRMVTMAERFLPYVIRMLIVGFVTVCWLLYFGSWQVLPGTLILVVFGLFRLIVFNIDVKLRTSASRHAEQRLGLLREVLTIITSVKLNCLEDVYEKKICSTRWEEVKYKGKRWILMSISYTFTSCGQHLAAFVTVMVFVFTDVSKLSFQTVFAVMFLTGVLGQIMCVKIPTGVHFSIDILNSLERIQRFIRTDHRISTNNFQELYPSPILQRQQYNKEISEKSASGEPYLYLEDVTCKLPSRVVATSQKHGVHGLTLLKGINLNVSSPGLVVVTGSVGSGKSIFLSSFLNGELAITHGSVRYSGKIAYVSDKPWVFPGTIRENILFGLPYNKHWYIQTIKACQLEKDFKAFPRQDSSLIGENGSSVSGGQRTRIALARAVYSQADIYLLDDPLSSLDAKVAQNIFKHCIKSLLSDRIVVLTTHAHRYIKEADEIVKLDGGQIVAQGTFDDVVRELPDSNHEEDVIARLPGDDGDDASSTSWDDKIAPDEIPDIAHSREVKEDHVIGSISLNVYTKYFLHGAPVSILLLTALVFYSGQGLMVLVDIQVSSLPKFVNTEEKFHHTILVYATSFMIAVFMTALGTLCIFLIPMNAAYSVHNKMVSSLLAAPLTFYTMNPVGRILNRFSQDISNLDELLPYCLVFLSHSLTPAIAAIVFCCITEVSLIPAVIVAVLTSYLLSRFFFRSAMDIKRLMSSAGSPLYSHFSNTMEGLKTIRVFNQQEKFTDDLFRHIDHHHKAMFAYYTAARWFAMSLDLLLLVFTTIVAVVELYTATAATAVFAALTIMYAVNSSRLGAGVTRVFLEVNSLMTSAERTLAYTEIKPEEGQEITKQPPDNWPNRGSIKYNNVSLRYHKEGPNVLKNITFEIEPCERIGIVGRTGAGKSSLVASLLKLASTDGEIFIDGLNINEDVNVRALRMRISVISQTPVLFNGSVRENLDPCGEFEDSQIWNALEKLNIASAVRDLPQKLESKITGVSDNFSVGQRQMLHLARVLLKRNKIVVFDEATGKVDETTDEGIQKIVRNVFNDCTVITISHRLSSIQDCDRVMVLDNATIAEFDKLNVLLNTDGKFRELWSIFNQKPL